MWAILALTAFMLITTRHRGLPRAAGSIGFFSGLCAAILINYYTSKDTLPSFLDNVWVLLGGTAVFALVGMVALQKTEEKAASRVDLVPAMPLTARHRAALAERAAMRARARTDSVLWWQEWVRFVIDEYQSTQDALDRTVAATRNQVGQLVLPEDFLPTDDPRRDMVAVPTGVGMALLSPVASKAEDIVADKLDLHRKLDLPDFDLGLDVHLPFGSTALALAEKYQLYKGGELNLGNAAADAAGRVGAGLGGAMLGAAVLTMFFGPAGTVVGKFGGGFLGRLYYRWWKEDRVKAEISRFNSFKEGKEERITAVDGEFKSFLRERGKQYLAELDAEFARGPHVDRQPGVRIAAGELARGLREHLEDVQRVRADLPRSAVNRVVTPVWLDERHAELDRADRMLATGRAFAALQVLVAVNQAVVAAGWGTPDINWKRICSGLHAETQMMRRKFEEWKLECASELTDMHVSYVADVNGRYEVKAETIVRLRRDVEAEGAAAQRRIDGILGK